MRIVGLVLMVSAVGCSKPTGESSASSKGSPSSAMEVCERLVTAGVAKGCVPEAAPGASEFEPGGNAKEFVRFALASSPKQAGKVLLFATSAEMEKAAAGYEALKGLAINTFVSTSAKTIVWLNVDASKEEARKTEGIVHGL